MSFDSSRFTFNPWNDFLGVTMQQGRVQLDSDWNEWLAEFSRRIQAGTVDTMGRAVVPATTPNAFKVSATVDAGGTQHVLIGAGRMYVDGLMVENHGPTAAAKWDSALSELSGAPAAPPTVAEIDLDYTAQPYLPNAALPKGPGPFLAYLDVWKRPITYLEHPELIDPAVGIDTTGRVQMAWQVKLLDVSQVAGVTCATPDTSIAAWQSLIEPSGALLTTAVVPSATAGPCCLNTATGYTGMENQLYRVEIHQGGGSNSSGTSSPIAASFKWSRDNASVITAVSAINPATNVANNPTSQLTVQSTGRDNVLSFKPGDWIEITDDFMELNGVAGELHAIDTNGVSKALKTIRLQTPVSSDLQTRLASGTDYHTRICRWDQNGKVYQSDGATLWVDLGAVGSTGQIPVPPPGTSLILENGVTVTFGLNATLGNFHIGDFWTFAARASDGTVQVLAQAPPMGVHHHYARLSIVAFPTTASDCRAIWPPVVSSGGDCACTVCVEAAAHNSGTATIAMAVEKIRSSGGGRICLGPGLFVLGSALQLDALKSVVISGQGPATALVFAGAGPAIEVQQTLGLRIEDLIVYAIAASPASPPPSITSPSVTGAAAVTTSAGAPSAIGILLRNSVETAIERCAVYSISAAASANPTTGATLAPSANTIVTLASGLATNTITSLGSLAVALDGFLVEILIRDNLLSADIGIGEASRIASLSDARSIMVLADLEVAGNLFPCNLAGVAFNEIGAASENPAQLNIFLLETALRENRIIGCSLVGVGIEGVSMPGASIRLAGNQIAVSGTGILCGADNADITDNHVTGGSLSATATGVAALTPPGAKLPIAQVRVQRNQINNYVGRGIAVSGQVLTSLIAENSIMNVQSAGISVAGPTLPSAAMVRNNAIFAVGAPPPAAASIPVAGIQISNTTTAVIENNSVALIGIQPSGTPGAVGIGAANVANATIAGNDINDIGPLTTGGNGTSYGISVFADTVGIVNVSSNVIRQTTSGSVLHMPFMGIVIGPNVEPSTPAGFTGQAMVNGNMVFGNDAYLVNAIVRDCVVSGNFCQLAADLPGNPSAAAVAAVGITCIASNNRIVSPGKLSSLSIGVSGSADSPKAAVVGNIVSTPIQLNGAGLANPWLPLNVIA